MTRAIEVRVDVAPDLPDAWCLVAECADERTELIFMGKQWRDLFAKPEALTSGAFAESVVGEHYGRCRSCRIALEADA